MTDNEMNKLADLIIGKMMVKQQEYDEQFIKDISIATAKSPELEIEVETSTMKVRDKIKHLEEELAIAVADERFLDASNYQQKINNLKDKYNL